MDINLTNPVTTAKIGEVVNGASAATPNDTDLLPVIDTSVTKKLTLTNLKAFLKTYFDTLYTALTASSFGTFLTGLTGKTTPVDADEFVISDSAASNVAKKVTGTNFKAFLKTYFDTIYQAAGTYLTSSNITQTITNGVTDKAPSEDAVFDALALKQDKVTGVDDTEIGYLNGVTSAIQTQLDGKLVSFNYGFAAINPADATSYYFCAFITGAYPGTSSSGRPVKFAHNMVLNAATFTSYQSVNGSAGDVTLYLRNESTATDYTVGTFPLNSGAQTFSAYNLTGISISVNTTDTYVWKMLMPTWVTNPTGFTGNLAANFKI